MIGICTKKVHREKAGQGTIDAWGVGEKAKCPCRKELGQAGCGGLIAGQPM